MRVERCACGGLIVAEAGQERLRIEAHQATRQHRDWRAIGGMNVEVYGFDVHAVALANWMLAERFPLAEDAA